MYRKTEQVYGEQSRQMSCDFIKTVETAPIAKGCLGSEMPAGALQHATGSDGSVRMGGQGLGAWPLRRTRWGTSQTPGAVQPALSTGRRTRPAGQMRWPCRGTAKVPHLSGFLEGEAVLP